MNLRCLFKHKWERFFPANLVFMGGSPRENIDYYTCSRCKKIKIVDKVFECNQGEA